MKCLTKRFETIEDFQDQIKGLIWDIDSEYMDLLNERDKDIERLEEKVEDLEEINRKLRDNYKRLADKYNALNQVIEPFSSEETVG